MVTLILSFRHLIFRLFLLYLELLLMFLLHFFWRQVLELGSFSLIIVFSFSIFISINQHTSIRLHCLQVHDLINFDRNHYQIRLYLSYFLHNLLHHCHHHQDHQNIFVLAPPKKDLILLIFCD